MPQKDQVDKGKKVGTVKEEFRGKKLIALGVRG
jgi:hypothetical protein